MTLFVDRRGSLTTGTLRALIVGAGAAGRALERDLHESPEFGLEPVGFLDDRNAEDMSLPRLGAVEDLDRVADSYGIDVVLVAIPSLPVARIRAIVQQAKALGLIVRTLPSFIAALERDVRVSDLRALDVAELLGRQEVHVLSPEARAVIGGKRVLVTGAGGSIGSELCRQVHDCEPADLFMLDHDESNLHGLQLEMHGEALLDDDSLLIADIRDRKRIRRIFEELRPEVVFHAAAHKHLPLLEMHPCEGVKSNVRGTQNLLDAAIAVDSERFILISTDKAANPVSVLGATKRTAELLVRRASLTSSMACASVRFGNVLGSRGSLLTVLSEQVLQGTAITITHPDVTRYFMTVQEAVGLVLEAGRLANGGCTYVLDMGEPVRIVDLVASFAAQVYVDQPEIRFTGLRPGEKLNEQLWDDAESVNATGHPRISAAGEASLPAEFDAMLEHLYAAADDDRKDDVREVLAELLPEFRTSPVRIPPPRVNAVYADGF